MTPKQTPMLGFRRRLALVHLAVIVTVLALTALVAHWSLARLVHGKLDAALVTLAKSETAMLVAGEPVKVHEAPPDADAFSFVRLDRLIQITDADGKVLARSGNLGGTRLPTPPALLARVASGETVFDTLERFGEEPARMVSMPASVGKSLLVVQVAGSLDDVLHVVSSASTLFVIMGVALLLAVGATGEIVTGRIFRAIDDVVRQAQSISDANLGERLPHPGTQDEIGHLVDSLNAMLDRLQRAFDAQRRFTADASHELRSPLSRLRTELEVTLRRPREPMEYVQALRSCMDEAERLTALVEELLALARLDAGQDRKAADSVLLHLVAQDAIERVRPHALERRIDIELSGPTDVSAYVPRAAASLALCNLLDNAVKFSPAGARVTVGLASKGGQAIASVSDTGPGIAPAELPHLFERFYRGSGPRAAAASGFGLGLALSQAVIAAHGGRIDAANRPGGGAVFTLSLPRAA